MARTPLNTQGQNLVVRSGDTIQGEDNASGSGSVLALRGGDSTGGSGGGANVTIDGGSPDTGGAGGSVLIRGTAGDGAGIGGSVQLAAGASTGTNGDVFLRAGGVADPGSLDGTIYAEATSDSAGVGGAVIFATSGFFGKPGFVGLNAGSGLAGNTSGGPIEGTGGQGIGTGDGGDIQWISGNSGNGLTGDGGRALLEAGSANSTNGNGGSVEIQSGTSSGGGAGDVILRVGVTPAPVTPVDGTIQAVASSSSTASGANLILRQGSSGSFFGSGGYGASLIGGSAIAASTAAGDDVHIAAGAGDTTGDGGWASVIAGNSGTTAGAVAGSVYIAAGSNTGSQDADDQGSVDLYAGNPGALGFKPGRVSLKASDDVVLGAGASLTVSPPDGSVPAAGSLFIAAGDGLAANAGGSVNIESGSSVSGTPGVVNLRTKANGFVAVRTQSTFTGTQLERRTFGSQQTTGAGNSFLMVVVGSLDTDGQNLQLTVNAQGVNNADDADVVSGYIVQSFYRATGIVRTIPAHVDDQQFQGAWPSSTTPSFGLVINGDDIELHFQWTGVLSSSITVNLAANWSRQEGGFTS